MKIRSLSDKRLTVTCLTTLMVWGGFYYFTSRRPALSVYAHRLKLTPVSAENSIINGSEHPELIPDDRAYHIVLLLASAADQDSDAANGRARAVVRNMHLTTADSAVVTEIATRYRKAFLTAASVPSSDDETFDQERQTRIWSYVEETHSRLTPLGVTKFNSYVQRAKKNIRLVPLPNMKAHQVGLLDRLLSIQVVHAQNMHPYGTISSFLTPDGNTPIVWGTGITDSSASCSCHVSSVWTTIKAPSGGTASQSKVSQPGGYAETDAEYFLQNSDFANGDFTINSTHDSYCPYCQCMFINAQSTSAVGTTRFIQAYYYCTPKGGPCTVSFGEATYNRCRPRKDECDVVTGFKITGGNYPAYIFANALLIIAPGRYGAEEICIGGSIIATDGCGTSDPHP